MKRFYYFSELSSVVQADEIKVNFLRHTALGVNGRDFKRCRCQQKVFVVYLQQKVVLKRSKKNPTVFGIFCFHVDL